MQQSTNTPEFDQYASSYDQLLDDPLRKHFAGDPLHFHRRKWLLIQALLRRAGMEPFSTRWLDVGCGRGELLELGREHFLSAVGCDPSAEMLSANEAFEVVRQESPVQLPFEDQSMDFVTAVCVYHHVHGEARRLLTDEIARVLTPKGLCCIMEHNPWNPVAKAIVNRCPVDRDAELLSARHVKRLVSASGLSVVSTDYFLFLPESMFARFGRAEKWLSRMPIGGQYSVVARRHYV